MWKKKSHYLGKTNQPKKIYPRVASELCVFRWLVVSIECGGFRDLPGFTQHCSSRDMVFWSTWIIEKVLFCFMFRKLVPDSNYPFQLKKAPRSLAITFYWTFLISHGLSPIGIWGNFRKWLKPDIITLVSSVQRFTTQAILVEHKSQTVTVTVTTATTSS